VGCDEKDALRRAEVNGGVEAALLGERAREKRRNQSPRTKKNTHGGR